MAPAVEAEERARGCEEQRDKRKKPCLNLYDLPGVILSRIGGYLCTGDCLVAVRICKSNQGLRPLLGSVTKATVDFLWKEDVDESIDPTECYKAQVSSLMICSSLRSLFVHAFIPDAGSSVTFFPASIVSNFLESNIGRCLRALEIQCPNDEKMAEIAPGLKHLQSLEKFRVDRRCVGEYQEVLNESAFTCLLSSLPKTITSLTIDDINGQVLRHLSKLIKDHALPALQELYLPCIMMEEHKDAEALNAAFMSPSGDKLKVLHLYVSELVTDEPWHMTEVILGLSKSTNQSSPKKTKGLASLQKLIVGHINWYSMGFHLMEGAFERLVEVRGIAVDYIPAGEEEYDDYLIDDVPDWYNVNVETLNLWCDLFRCRNIRYGNAICFTLSLEAPPPSHDLVCRLLGYLAQPIGLKILSNIDTLELDKVSLIDPLCIQLCLAISSGNLRSIKSLSFILDPTCQPASYEALGRVILGMSSLSDLAMGINCDEDQLTTLPRWEAFFRTLPKGKVLNLHKFRVGAPTKGGGPGSVFFCLASLGGRPVLGSVRELQIRGVVTAKDLMGFSTALLAGCFPALKTFAFMESELQALSDDTGAIRLLLHALSEKTKVEELWFGCRSRGLDRHMFLSLSSLLLQFLTQSKDHLPYLDLISIPGGLDFDSQDVVFRFHNEIKALRPQKKFQVVILDDYSNWVFDLE